MAVEPQPGLDAGELDALAGALGWPREELERMLDEARALFDATVEEYVRARHAAYRGRRGLRNEQIFALIQRDVRAWRFRAPELSTRQIRRIIYG